MIGLFQLTDPDPETFQGMHCTLRYYFFENKHNRSKEFIICEKRLIQKL